LSKKLICGKEKLWQGFDKAKERPLSSQTLKCSVILHTNTEHVNRETGSTRRNSGRGWQNP